MKFGFRHALLVFLGLNFSAADAQMVKVFKFDELTKRRYHAHDSIVVINIWATWCKPCVEELPGFLKLEQEFENKRVRFVYLSIDFKRELETKLLPFLRKNQISSEVILLDEPDYNSWIDKIDPSWQGSIPATLITDAKAGKQLFHEGELTYEELKSMINPLLP
ncbi:MAG: TlpA family protein disulfide reductase [Bacteroidia bacterium]|nr:TlpA family protein disulfide reductase [Bacteroidia bacterium]